MLSALSIFFFYGVPGICRFLCVCACLNSTNTLLIQQSFVIQQQRVKFSQLSQRRCEFHTSVATSYVLCKHNSSK